MGKGKRVWCGKGGFGEDWKGEGFKNMGKKKKKG